MKFLKLGLVLLSFIAFLACTQNPTGNSINVASNGTPAPAAATPMATADPLEMGRKLYADNCMICHKEDGTGGKVVIEGKTLNPENLTEDKIKAFSDEKIAGYIFNGVTDEGMPAFKDKLSEAQIREVVKYVRVGIQKMPAKPVVSPGRY